ncbi:MAG: S8 family serine peptidase [Bacteroidota bacterium]
MISLLLGVWGGNSLLGQEKYWVQFVDKAPVEAFAPEQLLSPAALANRARQGIQLDDKDVPVTLSYLRQVEEMTQQTGRASRWINAVSLPLWPDQIAQVQSLTFVQKVWRVGGYASTANLSEIQEDCPNEEAVGTHLRQLNMLGLDVLHRNGFTGKGVTIAVFDNGYHQVDSLEGFAHLFAENRILATKDYVDGDASVFHPCVHCRHGTYVFSILSAKMPGQLMGSAPDANYILLRTENDASETHQEEDNWLFAAEFADSLGAQIFTTSLGYFRFDPGEGNYAQSDMDGNTAIITRAADLAASRGIMVLNSAGNYGGTGLVAPADGDSVLAIGAVNECEEYASFSSQGFSADGRIKPDLTAMGERTFFLHPAGDVRRNNGTSFSCPLVSGLTACLLQAYPEADLGSMYDALKQSADRYDTPNRFFGYGIPNGVKAAEMLGQQLGAPVALDSDLRYQASGLNGSLLIYPNPSQGSFWLQFGEELAEVELEVEVTDLMGRRVEVRDFEVSGTERQLTVIGTYPSGMYVVRVYGADGGRTYFSRKVMLVH